MSSKQSTAAQKARDEEDIRCDDLPALIVVPECLEIPPWNIWDENENLPPSSIPLCCVQLPTGASLLSANFAALRRAGVKEIWILAHEEVMNAVETHIQEKCW